MPPAPGTAPAPICCCDYKARVYPEVQALLERVDTGIYFLTVDDEIYMVRNLLDHDFTPYAMLVLGLEKSEVFQSLYGLANVAITGVSIDGAELPWLRPRLNRRPAADSIRLTATATRSS